MERSLNCRWISACIRKERPLAAKASVLAGLQLLGGFLFLSSWIPAGLPGLPGLQLHRQPLAGSCGWNTQR